jgi:hypothetical protein
MDESTGKPNRINRLLYGERIRVGERTVMPVARLSGWHGAGQAEGSRGFGGWGRLTPVEVVVSGPDGTEQHVPISDVTWEALRGLMRAGLALACICLAIMLVAAVVRQACKSKNLRKEQNDG